MEFVRKTKMFDQPAVQLTDEEIAKATAAKQRRQAILNTAKKLGIGVAAATLLYKGAQYYNNGGSQFVHNVIDQGANAAGRIGDAVVDAAKGVGTATVNEANRGLNNWAMNRVNRGLANQIVPGVGIVQAPTGQGANTAANNVVNQVTSQPSQVPTQQLTQPQPEPSGAEINQAANELTSQVTQTPVIQQPESQVTESTPVPTGAEINAQANEAVNNLVQPPVQVPEEEQQDQEVEQ